LLQVKRDDDTLKKLKRFFGVKLVLIDGCEKFNQADNLGIKKGVRNL